MILLAFGGRDFRDRDFIFATLDKVHAWRPIDVLIEGEAPGADRISGEWADARGIHCARVKALWNVYQGKAGPLRNRAMRRLRPDFGIGFPGGHGTADMANLLREHGIPFRQVRPDGP